MADDIDLRLLGEQIRHLQVDIRQIKACINRSVTESDLAALKSKMAQIETSLAGFENYIDDRTLELLNISFQALKDEIEPLMKV